MSVTSDSDETWVGAASRESRALGRQGIADLIDRCCALARRLADQLGSHDGVEILNEVVLNQVLVRLRAAGDGDSDEFTREVIRRVQADGTCWLGGTLWHGQAAMRTSVSNWSTDESDVDRAVEGPTWSDPTTWCPTNTSSDPEGPDVQVHFATTLVNPMLLDRGPGWQIIVCPTRPLARGELRLKSSDPPYTPVCCSTT